MRTRSVARLSPELTAKFTAKFHDEGKKKVQMIRRESPAESHPSLGAGERANQTVEGFWRTTHADLEDTLREKLKASDPISAWLPQRVA